MKAAAIDLLETGAIIAAVFFLFLFLKLRSLFTHPFKS
jgi:hypothetical protein